MARCSRLLRAAKAALAALWLALAAGPIAAADPAAAPSEAEIEALVGQLEDPEQRQQLIDRLRLLTQAQSGEPGAVEPGSPAALGGDALAAVQAGLAATAQEAGRVVATVGRLPADLAALARHLGQPAVQAKLFNALGRLAAVVVLAGLAWWLAARAVQPLRRRLVASPAEAWLDRLGRSLGRLLVEAVPLLALAAVGFGALGALATLPASQQLGSALLAAALGAGAGRAVGRALLMPEQPGSGLVPAGAATARILLRWLGRFLAVGALGYVAVAALAVLGAPPGWQILLDHVYRLALLGFALAAVLKAHRPVAGWLRGSSGSGRFAGLAFVRRRLAAVWSVLVVAALVVLYLAWALGIPGGVQLIATGAGGTVAVIAVAGLLDSALSRLLGGGSALPAGLGRWLPGLQQRSAAYAGWALRLAQAVLWLAALGAVLASWGVPMGAVLAAPATAAIWDSLSSIALVLVGALLVWEFAAHLIDRSLSRGDPETQSARLQTLLPLLRKVLIAVLGVMVALIVLSELGVNIGPLLAGAGVFGLAIGFGSQQLVRDIITGAFILMENSVRVGDVVTVGGLGGVVEALTVRTIRLRDYSGNVHTIPFSDVSSITNMTRDFAYAVLDIGVAYREDVDRVIAEMKAVGAELRQDPEVAEYILDDLEIAGVNSLDDSAVTIRCRFMTKPIWQWTVARAYRRKLKARFDARGIEIPFPHRTVYFGGSGSLPDGSGEGATAAAGAS